jgi:hypothetical protein
MTTDRRRLVPGEAEGGGYRRLVPSDGETSCAPYIDLLNGGEVRPDSGDPRRYEGVAGKDVDDERYWHPDGGGPDLPRTRYGFPEAPGVLAAAGRPFRAALARELAASDWQVRDQIAADGGAGAGAGTVADRNVVLPIGWPRSAPHPS